MAKPDEEDPIDDKPMPLLDHLIELRRRLMWSMLALGLTFFVCYYFSNQIYSFLAQPLATILEQRGQDRKMIFTSLTEGFFTYLKVAFFGAAFHPSPSSRPSSGCSSRPACTAARSGRWCRSWWRRRCCS